jgi:hypothetical protein
MVRDFGPAAFIVFALPNVVGAAALGWVLHRPGAAATVARRHWPAAAAFSLVTILFHAFFAGWIIRALVGDAAGLITAAAAAGFYFYGRRGRRDLPAAAGLLAFSLIAFVIAASLPGHVSHIPPGRNIPGLIWLAPVCIFGFLLNPYLDLTFLRARASTDSPTGIAAFTLGFGIFFLAMITFTLWYTGLLAPSRLTSVPRPFAWIIAGHMMLQSAFTIALHTRALSEDRRAKDRYAVLSCFAALLLTYLIGTGSEHLVPRTILPSEYTSGEFVYRLFLSFYGLIFPAYVWLFMIPAGRGKVIPSGRKWVVLAVTVVIAAPMFWLGFIDNRMIWLGPGLLVVMASRIALRGFAERQSES